MSTAQLPGHLRCATDGLTRLPLALRELAKPTSPGAAVLDALEAKNGHLSTSQILSANPDSFACGMQDDAGAGDRWQETGYVFTFPDGRPLSPDRLTRMFAVLVRRSGLPPVTLHGLRRGAATIALAAGAGLRTVQAMLGHSSIQVTADIYLAVLPETTHRAAEATAALLFLRGAGHTARSISCR